MGNAAARAQPQHLSQLDTASQYRTYLLDYSNQGLNIVFVRLIGDGKFVKSIHCKCDGGALIVKIYRKYHQNEDLTPAEISVRKLIDSFSLANHPNIIPYCDVQYSKKSNVAFLVRQYFVSNLYDRFSTRPFLSLIERKWIAFQLLKALEQCHGDGHCHGDIKSENIMVTSWNWIFLTDFAPFKPTYLPEDDPADYYYYFCTGNSRRSCNVAPERFYGTSASGIEAIFLSNLEDSCISAEELDRQVDLYSNSSSTTTGRTALHSRGNSNKRDGPLRDSMDIFSIGCVLGELFLGGKPVFDLPTLLRYRTGDDTAIKEISKIGDPVIEELIRHMLQRDPRQRLSAFEYRTQCTGKGKVFPSYFNSFLFRFLVCVLGRGVKTPDSRIRLVCRHYGRILRELAGVEDPAGEEFFRHRLSEGYAAGPLQALHADIAQRVFEETTSGVEEHEEIERTDKSQSETMNLIEKTKSFIDKVDNIHVTTAILLEEEEKAEVEMKEDRITRRKSSSISDLSLGQISNTSVVRIPPEENGIIIILSLICSSIRHVNVPQSKVTGLQLIVRLGAFTSDEARLQRLIPFALEILDDRSATARMAAIRTICQLLSMIQTFPLSDANVFPLYILPALNRIPSDPEEMVRVAFAECLPKFAETSRRFLDIAQAMRTTTTNEANTTSSGIVATPNTNSSTLTSTSTSTSTTPSSSSSPIPSSNSVNRNKSRSKSSSGDISIATGSYDSELSRLHQMISRLVIQIAAPDQKASSSLVKRALLQDITRLCIFFGRERTLDVVLPQLITFLNDRDWELRAAFFEHISGVCAFVGRVSLELYILPCIEQALIDIEELVIARALRCLATLCELGMFQRHALIEKAKTTASLLFHPALWILDAVIHLMVAIAQQLGTVDVHAFLLPVLRPYLQTSLLGKTIDMETLRRSLRPPVSREAFDAALIASDPPGEEDGRKSREGDLGVHSQDMQDMLDAIGVDLGEAASSRSMNVVASMDGYTATTPDDETTSSFSAIQEPGGSARASAKKSTNNRSINNMSINNNMSTNMMRMTTNTSSYSNEEAEKLQMMHKYVEVASMHMKSKLQLARSEHAARLHGQDRTRSTSYAKKLHRSLLHTLRVPDMRFALLHAPPVRPPYSRPLRSSTVGNEVSKEGGSGRPESLAMPYVIRLHGLQATTTSSVASSYQSNNSSDNNANDSFSEFNSGSNIPTGLKSGKKSVQMNTKIDSKMDPALLNSSKLQARIASLQIPPLPPDMGPLRSEEGTLLSMYSLPGAISGGLGNYNTSVATSSGGLGGFAAGSNDICYRDWRPCEGVLAVELTEHTGAVNRIGVAQDNMFFASASNDSTVKLWSTKYMAHNVNHRSKFTHTCKGGGKITDLVVCDNSHAVAYGTSNGSVSVFKVESKHGSSTASDHTSFYTTKIKELSSGGGEGIVAVTHMNNVTESMLVYATQKGYIFGWDLRSRNEAWVLKVSPELGYITCLTHAKDAMWLAAGTSRGFITLWNLQFQLLVKVWRHSSLKPIYRMEPCLGLPPAPSIGFDVPSLPLVFVAAGDNEVAVWDLSSGACRSVMRTLKPHASESDARKCPILENIRIPSSRGEILSSILGSQGFDDALKEVRITSCSEPVVRAILSPSLYLRGIADCLITAGDDKHIRYWDLRNAKTSFTISGVNPGEPRAFYDSQEAPKGWWKSQNVTEKSGKTNSSQAFSSMSPPLIYLCQDASIVGTANPLTERRGPVPPSPDHNDTILDLKLIDAQIPMIVSTGREGIIKVWR